MVYKAVVLESAEGRGKKGVFLEGCSRAILRFGVHADHETRRGEEDKGRQGMARDGEGKARESLKKGK
jgi:hypothetical protein